MSITRGSGSTVPRLMTLALAIGLLAGCASTAVDQATDGSPASTIAPAQGEAGWDSKYLQSAFEIQIRSIEFSTQYGLAEASTDVMMATFEGVEQGPNLFAGDPNEHGGGHMLYLIIKVTEVTKGASKAEDVLKVVVPQASIDLEEFRRAVPEGTPVLLFGSPSEALRELGVNGVLSPFNTDALVFGDPDGSGFVKPLKHEIDETGKLEELVPK